MNQSVKQIELKKFLKDDNYLFREIKCFFEKAC